MSFKAFVWAWDQDVPNGDYHHVLLALANIAPGREVRASVVYIAKQVRRSPRKVRGAIEWLEQAALITITERPGKADLIRLNIPTDFRVSMPDEEDDLEMGERGRPRKTPAHDREKPLQNPYTPYADEPREPEEGTSLSLRTREPFDQLWAIWPKKVAKEDARKAWRQMTKEINELGLTALLEKAQAYADHVVDYEDRGILHAATWLRGKRWNDELTDRSDHNGNSARAPGRADPAAQRNQARLDAMDEGARIASAIRKRERWSFE